MATPILLAPCPEVQPVAWHLSVGIGIGILGFLGVVVPLIRERISRREKAIWTALMALLLFLELRSIRLDEKQHDREQAFAACEQQRSFQEITDQANRNFDATATGLNSSIKGLGKLLGTTQTIFRQTIPHADLRSNGVILKNAPEPSGSFNSSVKYWFDLPFSNEGSRAAHILRKAVKFYVGKPDDLAAQKQIAAEFEEDWKAVPQSNPSPIVTLGGPHFWSESRIFTNDEIERIMKGETIYTVERFEYSDPTGTWRADWCEHYQVDDSKFNVFVIHPCRILMGDRYRAKQP